MLGEQFLVGRHDRLARGQCTEDEASRRLDPADQLDDDVDVGIGDHIVDPGRQDAGREGDGAGRRDVQIGDLAEAQRSAESVRDEAGVLHQEPGGPGPDRPEADDPDADRLHHVTLLRAFSR